MAISPATRATHAVYHIIANKCIMCLINHKEVAQQARATVLFSQVLVKKYSGCLMLLEFKLLRYMIAL